MDNNSSNNESQGYPKLQWSVFVKNGKDMQYVVRANDPEEFAELKTFVLTEVAKDLIAAGANVPQQTISPVEPVRVKACSTCGAEAQERKGTSKTGKAYHAIFCSTENKAHTQWL